MPDCDDVQPRNAEALRQLDADLDAAAAGLEQRLVELARRAAEADVATAQAADRFILPPPKPENIHASYFPHASDAPPSA